MLYIASDLEIGIDFISIKLCCPLFLWNGWVLLSLSLNFCVIIFGNKMSFTRLFIVDMFILVSHSSQRDERQERMNFRMNEDCSIGSLTPARVSSFIFHSMFTLFKGKPLTISHPNVKVRCPLYETKRLNRQVCSRHLCNYHIVRKFHYWVHYVIVTWKHWTWTRTENSNNKCYQNYGIRKCL